MTTTGNLTLLRNGELLVKRQAYACDYNDTKVFCPHCYSGQSKAVLAKTLRCPMCEGEVTPGLASYEAPEREANRG